MAEAFADIEIGITEVLNAEVLTVARTTSAAGNLLALVQKPDEGNISPVDYVTDAALSALTAEISPDVGRNLFAMDQFFSGNFFARVLNATQAKREGVMREVIDRHVDNYYAFVNNDTLAKIVDGIISKRQFSQSRHDSELLSPLFSVWCERLREEGQDPVITLDWKYGGSPSRYVYFGKGMHDVNLTLRGLFNGQLGERAENCTFMLDEARGNFGNGSVDCHFTFGKLNGSLFSEAKRASLVCEKLNARRLKVGNGFVIIADTVSADIMPTRNYDRAGEPATVQIKNHKGFSQILPEWS